MHLVMIGHFIMKKLAEEFKKQITCLSTEKKNHLYSSNRRKKLEN